MASAVTGARVQPQFGRVGSSLRDQRPGVAVPSRGSAVKVEAANKKGGTKRQDIRVTVRVSPLFVFQEDPSESGEDVDGVHTDHP
jgi:hypothetical protein